MSTRLVCPQCHTAIPKDKINKHKLIAVCPVCGTVFDFLPRENKPKSKQKSAPPNLRVEEKSDQATYTFWWATCGDILSFSRYAVFFIALMIFAVPAYFTSNDKLIAVLTFLVAAHTLYLTLVRMFNKTSLIITAQTVNVESHPFPFKTNRTFDSREITGVLYKQNPPRLKHFIKSNLTYGLWIIDEQGEEKHLADVLDEDMAIYLGRRIKYYLGLLK